MTQDHLESLAAGTIVAGKYEVLGRLGSGAMGIVYKARDTVLRRELVLKFLLKPQQGTLEEGNLLRRRFIREAQSAARLNHPNIVTIYEADQFEGLYYIAMELVESGSLEQLVTKLGRPTEIADICGWIMQACLGLAEAHREGIIHRDVKPSNLLLSRGGQIKIADFGIAKVQAEVSGLTSAGTVIGTAAYMSPEQLQLNTLDGRSDQFSLGCVWYWLLTGLTPYDGNNAAAMLYKILFEPPPPVRPYNPAVSEELEQMVQRCMAKDRDQRFPSLYDLADAITTYLTSQNMIPTLLRPGSGPIPRLIATGQSLSPQDRTEPYPAPALASTQKLPTQTETASGPFPRPVVAQPTVAPQPGPQKQPSKTWKRIAAVLLLALLGGGGWFTFQRLPRWQADRSWSKQEYEAAYPLYSRLFFDSPVWDPLIVQRLQEFAAFKQKNASIARPSSLRLLNRPGQLSPLSQFLFSERANIGIDSKTYDSLETLPENLSGFDLLIVPEGGLQEMIQGRSVVPLDHFSIPNLKNLDPFFQNLGHDRGNEYGIPFSFGTIGLLYDSKKYTTPPDSWSAVFDAAQAKDRKIAAPEAPRVLVGLALKLLGHPFNTTEAEPLAQAIALAAPLAQTSLRLPASEAAAKLWLTRESFDLAIVPTSVGLTLQRQRPELRFVIPREGSNLTVDSLVIPRGARNAEAAYQFINHILEAHVGAELAQEMQHGSPNLAARQFLPEADLQNETLYPSLSVLNRCDFDLKPAEMRQAIERSGAFARSAP